MNSSDKTDSARLQGAATTVTIVCTSLALYLHSISPVSRVSPAILLLLSIAAVLMPGGAPLLTLKGGRYLIGALLLAQCVIGFFGVAPLYVVGAGLILTVILLVASRKPSARSAKALAAGIFLYAGTLLSAVWPIFDARIKQFPVPLASLISKCAMVLGYDNTVAFERSGTVSLSAITEGPVTFLLSGQNLAYLLFLLLLGGGLVHALLYSGHRTMAAVRLVYLTAAVFLGCCFIAVVETFTGKLALLPYQYQYGFALVCAILWGLVVAGSSPKTAKSECAFEVPRLASLAPVATALAIAAGIMFLVNDPGKTKPGRILVDEHHSDWEKSDLPMGRAIFGVKSVYNYACLSELLGKHYTVSTNRQELNETILSQQDVVLLKTPTKPYAPEEIAALRAFVENGGGLWLIGEHTNIFGIDTYLNQVLAVMSGGKVAFNPDAVNIDEGLYDRYFSQPNIQKSKWCGKRDHEMLHVQRYLNHPILGNNIPYMMMLTSCSVNAPLWAENVTVSRGTFADNALFGGNTFFGDMKYSAEERYGNLLQNVAFKYGKGRVALWSDSTIFSNFSMFMPGVPELALGYANWLNRTNNISFATWAVLVCILLCAYAGCCVVSKSRGPVFVVSLVCSMLLVAMFVPLIDWVNCRAYAIGDPRAGYSTVGFEEQYSKFTVPAKTHVHNEDPGAFETFYVNCQRLGVAPTYVENFGDCLNADMACLINPKAPLAPADLKRLQDYLASGHTLLVILNHADREAWFPAIEATNETLRAVGAKEKITALDPLLREDVYGPLITPNILIDVEIGGFIDGAATPLLLTSSNRTVGASVACGAGKIEVVLIGHLYNNTSLGEPSGVPDPMTLRVVKSMYALVARGVNVNAPDGGHLGGWDEILKNNQKEPPQVSAKAAEKMM